MITYSLMFTHTNLIRCIDSYFLSPANITSEMVPKWLHLELRLLAAGLVSAWVRLTQRETRPGPGLGREGVESHGQDTLGPCLGLLIWRILHDCGGLCDGRCSYSRQTNQVFMLDR